MRTMQKIHFIASRRISYFLFSPLVKGKVPYKIPNSRGTKFELYIYISLNLSFLSICVLTHRQVVQCYPNRADLDFFLKATQSSTLLCTRI